MQYSNLTCVSRRYVGKIQTAQNMRISVKTDIAEVLSVGVDNAVSSYEVSGGAVSFYGKTNVRFLYSDGTTVCGQNFNADFSAEISDPLLDADSKLTFDIDTLEVDTETNANTATVSVLLEICAYAYVTETTPYLCESEEAFCRMESVEYLASADIFDLSAVIDEELTATRQIDTVLLAESSMAAEEYTLREGVLHLNGTACVRLTYISEGNVITDTLPFKFDRELDAAGIDTDSQLRITLIPKNTKVRLDLAEEGTNNVFTAEIAVCVRTEATKVGVCDAVCDAYKSDGDFVFERRSLTTTLPCGSAVVRRRIGASLPLTDGRTPVTAVNISAHVTKCTSMERQAEVQGVVTATALYATAEGTKSQLLEIPFSETLPVDYLMPQCVSRATVSVSEFSVKGSGTLQAEAELCFTVESDRDIPLTVIVSAEEQPFDKAASPAIEVCLAHKGETLWQLCKGLHMSEEDLLAANPDITNPLQSDTKIVVFNKI